jgi:hypothetical protein
MSYVIKESYSNSHHKIDTYYHVSDGMIHWTTEQKQAQKFNSRLDAWAVADTLNRQGSSVRVVKLIKPKLTIPKPGTMFLDLTSHDPVPNMVSEVYEDYDDEDPYALPETYIFTLSLVASGREDSFCTLKEYNDFLKNGKIKVLWEPV